MKIIDDAQKIISGGGCHQINCLGHYFMFINRILSTRNYKAGKLKNYGCPLRRLGDGVPIVFGAFSHSINYRVWTVANGIVSLSDVALGMESDSICGLGLTEEGETTGRPSCRPWTRRDPKDDGAKTRPAT